MPSRGPSTQHCDTHRAPSMTCRLGFTAKLARFPVCSRRRCRDDAPGPGGGQVAWTPRIDFNLDMGESFGLWERDASDARRRIFGERRRRLARRWIRPIFSCFRQDARPIGAIQTLSARWSGVASLSADRRPPNQRAWSCCSEPKPLLDGPVGISSNPLERSIRLTGLRRRRRPAALARCCPRE